MIGRSIAMDSGAIEPSIGLCIGRANIEALSGGSAIHAMAVEAASEAASEAQLPVPSK